MNEKNKKTSEAESLVSVKKLFVDSWRIYVLKLSDFVEMYLRGLIGAIPMLILGLLGALLFYWLGFNWWPLYVLFGLLGLAAVAWAIYYGVRSKIGLILILENKEKSARENFLESKNFFFAYFAVSLLTGIIIFLSFLLLIIPGVILSVIWSMAALSVVLENKSTFGAAVKRSRELVKGYWWPVFGRFLAIGVLAFFVSLVMNIPVASLNEIGKQAYTFVVNVFWALISPLFLTYSYLLYKDLASKK